MLQVQRHKNRSSGWRRFVPIVKEDKHYLACKVTRMLLGIYYSKLLQTLESRESLRTKVEEAVQVLKAHQAKAGTP